MKKLLSFFFEILGIFLVILFSVIVITENTSVVNNYYAKELEESFEKKSNFNFDFDFVSVSWEGISPSLIFKNISIEDKSDEKISLSSKLLIIKFSIIFPSNDSYVAIREIDIVESNLNLDVKNKRFFLNNFNLTEGINTGQNNNFNPIKFRVSKSSIQLDLKDSGKKYSLENINAVIFKEKKHFKLFTTFNYDKSNQIMHLASKFSISEKSAINGEAYIKGKNINYNHEKSDLFNINTDFSNLDFTMWTTIEDSTISQSNGKLSFNKANALKRSNNGGIKLNNLNAEFDYNSINSSDSFKFKIDNVEIDGILYKDNNVLVSFDKTNLSTFKIDNIDFKTAKKLYTSLNHNYSQIVKSLPTINKGQLSKVEINNINSLPNLRFSMIFNNIEFSLNETDQVISGITGSIMGNPLKGQVNFISDDIKVSDKDNHKYKFGSIKGNIGYKMRPKSIKFFSDDIMIDESQKVLVSGYFSKKKSKINLSLHGDVSYLEKANVIPNEFVNTKFDVKSDYMIDYIFMRDGKKKKSYGLIELLNPSIKDIDNNLFIAFDNFKVLFLDNYYLSDSGKVYINNDVFDFQIDSSYSQTSHTYNLTASGLLSIESLERVLSPRVLESIDGKSKSKITLSYKPKASKPYLYIDLKSDLIGINLDFIDPFIKNKSEEKKFYLNYNFLNPQKIYDIKYETYIMRFSQKTDYLNMNVSSPSLNGNIKIPNEINKLNPLEARLQYLDISQFNGSSDPKFYPPMVLKIKRVKIDSSTYDNFNIITSYHDDGMIIENISFANQDLTMNGQGKWVKTENGQATFFDGNFNSDNFGKSLDRLGYRDLINKGVLSAQMIGQWSDSPEKFTLRNFDGKIILNLREGDFLQVTNETKVIGQLLGLFSIASLQKRLSLDFSDFFSSGLSFDEMTGEFVFDNSKTNVRMLNLKGTFGEMTINGESDIIKETHNHKLTYIPDLSSMSLISGTLLGGPIGAVASIFYDKVLKQIGIDTNELAAVEYSITGSWNNPKIKLIEPFKQIEN